MSGDRTVYGVAPATSSRGAGVAAIGLGACALAWIVVLLAGPPTWLLWLLGILIGGLGLVFVVLLFTALFRLAGRGPRLVVDADGFENHTGGRVGVRQATWREVKLVKATNSTLVIELRDGRQSLVEVTLLDVAPPQLADDLRARLNRRHSA